MSEPSTLAVLDDGAALVVRSDIGVIRVTGADRAAWLQGLLTNDVAALTPGAGCYAAWLTPQGRMTSDVIVLDEGDAITVGVPSPLCERLFGTLDAAIFAEDVQLAQECGAWSWLGVHGARSAAIVARALVSARVAGESLDADALAAWPAYAHTALPGGGRVFRRDPYGAPGYLLRIPPAEQEVWLSRLRLAGAQLVKPSDVEFARIEAGWPEFLVDMNDDTIPLEAGIEDRAISFTKGCYVGQEVIVRVVHRGGGRVARRLVGLRVSGNTVPAPGAAVRHESRDVGRVTSSAWSPRLRMPVALGYVRREHVEPGTTLAVDCDGTAASAVVSALPMR